MAVNNSNQSDLNHSSPAVAITPLYLVVLNTTTSMISFFSTLFLAAVITTLHKCKRMPHQVKRLSYNALLSDGAFHILLVIANVSIVAFGEEYRQKSYYPRNTAAATFHLVSMASVAGLTLDRIVAVTKPLSYNTIMSKKTVKYLTLYIWLVHAVVPITLAISLGYNCNWELSTSSCDQWTLLLPSRLVIAFFYVIYNPFIVFSYFVISKDLRQKIPNLPIQSITSDGTAKMHQDFRKLTRNIIRIVFVFEIANLPMLANALGLSFVPSLNEKFNTLISMAGYVCICSNSYLSMYYYVLKMKECKYVFLTTFLFWSEKHRGVADRLKQELYNNFVGPVSDDYTSSKSTSCSRYLEDEKTTKSKECRQIPDASFSSLTGPV